MRKKIFHSRSFLKFILVGSLLTILSQGSLLIMLFIMPLGVATFITQILHNYLAYLANKYSVFKREGKPIVYIFLVILDSDTFLTFYKLHLQVIYS